MFPFYTNVIVHFIFIAFMLFLLPESLSSEARAILSKNAQLSREAAIRRDTAEREWENETPAVEISDPLLSGPNMGCRVSTAGPSKSRKRAFGNAMRLGRRTFKFLEPLAIFLPRERDDGVGKDWTMCLMGCTMVSLSMMMVSTFRILYGRKADEIQGIMQTKTQFTFFAYGWTSAQVSPPSIWLQVLADELQLGPYMSLMGFSRAFTLLVFVPSEWRPNLLKKSADLPSHHALRETDVRRAHPDTTPRSNRIIQFFPSPCRPDTSQTILETRPADHADLPTHRVDRIRHPGPQRLLYKLRYRLRIPQPRNRELPSFQLTRPLPPPILSRSRPPLWWASSHSRSRRDPDLASTLRHAFRRHRRHLCTDGVCFGVDFALYCACFRHVCTVAGGRVGEDCGEGTE